VSTTIGRLGSAALTAIVAVGISLSAASAGEPTTGTSSAAPPSALKAITAQSFAREDATLATDAFEGRAPGTHGETVTIDWVERQFRSIGLAPGNPDGTYLQKVPMTGFTSTPHAAIRIGDRRIELKYPDDIVAYSTVRESRVEVAGSELVFVGYGVIAPEYHWDDYKGVDLRGKTLVMLINDPPVPDPKDPTRLDPNVFGGQAMTYYGRWTYKYEMAAKLGAKAAIIIHETGPAAYPYSVVVNSWARENFVLSDQPPNTQYPTVASWITEAKAREFLAAAGQDFDRLKRAAVSRDFRPVPLGASVDITIDNHWRDIDSHNVIGRIGGSDPALSKQYLIYSAHWDHFGWNPKLPGPKTRQIYHGAFDNASGVAALLELARAYQALPQPLHRSILFLATTGEEQGLLGARYYAQHPLYPLANTLADLNMDGIEVWGPTSDIEEIGAGKSTVDDVVKREAAAMGMEVKPDLHPERGEVYRAEQLEFARAVSVPSSGQRHARAAGLRGGESQRLHCP
jgi:Zn-dependent M28 family amino/carboxypeptidase